MTETVSCPECSRKLRLPREAMGGEVRCPMCQAAFVAGVAGGGRTEPVSPADEVWLRPWVEGERTVAPPPEPEVVSTRGRVVRVVGGTLAAAGIPLLAVGFGGLIGGLTGGLLWSALAIVLAGLGAVGEITRPERRLFRRVGPRTVWASVLVVGYLILGCGFLFDRSPVPPEDWQTFRPPEGGYRVKMPGRPAEVAWTENDAHVYRVRHEGSGLTFEVGELEVMPPARGRAWTTDSALYQGQYEAVERQYPTHLLAVTRYKAPDLSDSDVSWDAREYACKTIAGRYVAVRLEARSEGRRLFVLVVTAPFKISPQTEDVRRFFSSLRMEEKEGADAPP
jgi:hypothetical protein